MKEVTGNLWTYPADYRVITTNGTVKANGECVMGRGCAAEAKAKYRLLPSELGHAIKEYGNSLYLCTNRIISFPVKRNWWEQADLRLIQTSAEELADLIEQRDITEVIVMPRPGCGNGRLTWAQVRPVIDFLPDNVHVITWS